MNRIRCIIYIAMFCGVVVAEEPAALTVAQKTHYDQPQQPLGEALKEFGRASGLTIVVDASLARGVTAPELRGTYTPAEALDLILATTGLRAEYLDARTVAIR